MDPTWDLLYGYNHNGTPMQLKTIDGVLEEYAYNTSIYGFRNNNAKEF